MSAPAVPGSGLVAAPGAPDPLVDYSAALAERHTPVSLLRVRAAVGVIAALALYFIVVPLVSEAIVLAGWSMSGRPAPFSRYLVEAMGFGHPSGLLGTNVGLALLTPVVLAIARLLHGRGPEWVASVQPGMRWRYLLLCLPVALVALGAVQLVSSLGSAAAAPAGRQSTLWLWLLIIVLTSPLQAAGEEFLFRGYLLQAFGSMLARSGVRTHQAVAVVGSALVFALFHGVQNPALFVDRFGFGLLAGVLVLVTGGLEAGIACHVVNNLMAFGFAAFSGGIAQARALQAIGWGQALVDLFGFALFGLGAWLVAHPLRLATLTPAGPTADGGRLALSGETR